MPQKENPRAWREVHTADSHISRSSSSAQWDLPSCYNPVSQETPQDRACGIDDLVSSDLLLVPFMQMYKSTAIPCIGALLRTLHLHPVM
jgi:hypothetical protein